jgi:hypothetical protein
MRPIAHNDSPDPQLIPQSLYLSYRLILWHSVQLPAPGWYQDTDRLSPRALAGVQCYRGAHLAGQRDILQHVVVVRLFNEIKQKQLLVRVASSFRGSRASANYKHRGSNDTPVSIRSNSSVKRSNRHRLRDHSDQHRATFPHKNPEAWNIFLTPAPTTPVWITLATSTRAVDTPSHYQE